MAHAGSPQRGIQADSEVFQHFAFINIKLILWIILIVTTAIFISFNYWILSIKFIFFYLNELKGAAVFHPISEYRRWLQGSSGSCLHIENTNAFQLTRLARVLPLLWSKAKVPFNWAQPGFHTQHKHVDWVLLTIKREQEHPNFFSHNNLSLILAWIKTMFVKGKSGLNAWPHSSKQYNLGYLY